jgi:YbgC/YbaW family acyl-CoA thioester hydrolase
MSKEIFESMHKVRSYECDSYGHVNNATYLNFLEFARMEVLEKKSLTLDKLKKMGFFVLIRRVEIDYKFPAGMGDILIIKTYVSDHRKTSGTFTQEVIRENDKKPIATANVTWVFTNLQGRPVQMPSVIKEAFGT